MPRYRLVFEGTDTARIKLADTVSDEPVAWFRVTWGAGHEVVVVNVYSHAARIGDRAWLGACDSIAAAVRFCDDLDAGTSPGPSTDTFDWSGGSFEESTPPD